MKSSKYKKWEDMTFDERVIARDALRERENDPDVQAMHRHYRKDRKRSRLDLIRNIVAKKSK